MKRLLILLAALAAARSPAQQSIQLQNPDTACANCHRAIYNKYEQTSMARGSGLATPNLIPGAFHHQPSNIDYKVFLRGNAAWFSYSRPATDRRGPLAGEQRLQLFIGSSHRGRTFLYQLGSQWFELPVNFYTRRNTWDMAPAFDNAATLPAPLPVDPNCLHCHATDIQPSLVTARNRFASTPFRQGGIGCSACHGDPAAHLAAAGHAPITNPARLAPAQRDSACIQCHLEGDAVVYRPGRSLAQFTPGDNLADLALYFVRASQQTGGARATSQYEALLHSACKRASGDKLTCTSCHDPHFDPPPAQRVQYFRARCLACHTAPALAVNHFPTQPDCAHCHMPSRSTVDISHEQVTDHDIEARPRPTPTNFIAQSNEDLVPVGNFPASPRDYGLAYAQLAARHLPGAADKALHLLTQAAQSGASDEELNVRLAYLNQLAGNLPQARTFYTKTLEADPYEPTALANLAVLDASSNHLPEAIHLLDRLIAADPTQTPAGLNLAFIECKLGHPAEALALTHRLALFNPDDPTLRAFVTHGDYANQHCPLTPNP
jgi:predicted CXXCH cytochrome family protein